MNESFWSGVTPQAVSQAPDGFKEFKIGENDAYISKVEEKISESGNPMLVITFTSDDGATIKYYIVDGEYKLSMLKQLYSAFDIPMGVTDTRRWINKRGIVVCKAGEPYNGKVYNKVNYVKSALPGGQHTTPEQYPGNQNPPADGFMDDISF